MQNRTGPTYRVEQLLVVENLGRTTTTDVVVKSILYTEAGISSAQVKTTPLCRKVKDNQGNFFGYFKLGELKPKERQVLKLEVTLTPYVVNIEGRNFGTLKDIGRRLRQKYCGAAKHWESAAELQETVASITVGTDDISEILGRFFRFLDSLIYREHLKTRRGALRTLRSKYGDCDEFTDLFVAMARQVGIPARRVTGLFLRVGHPTHHAWAEVFTPKWSWLPFDPALGYFAASSSQHLPKKLEATVSEIPDYEVRFKSQRAATVKIHPLKAVPTVWLIKKAPYE